MPNPFAHIQLNTDDVSRAKSFYRRVFAWKLADQKMGPGVTYTMIDVGKGADAGIQKKSMPGAPNAWLPYVEVDDVKKAMDKAIKAGATCVVDYMEIPGGMGAFGVFTDPTGATLGVWGAARRPARKKRRAHK
jgi:hypothetical protein